MPSLDLYLHDRRVGVLTPDARNPSRVRLAIDSDYDPDAGVLLSEAFTTLAGARPSVEAVTNFLGGYVPEGHHRVQMAAKRRIDKDDLFALLDEFGGSIAGAVNLRRPGETSTGNPNYQPIDDRQLETILKQAVTDSDQGIPDDSRSTLPGYQPKVLAAETGGEWSYPHGRAHSTWILKPQVPTRPTRLFDEHYSHLLSARVGLSRYRSEIRQANRTTYLAIERFDRKVVDGAVELRHQEDMAQGMSLDWRNTDVKFQDPQWPTDPKRATVRRIAELLGSIPAADEAIGQWLRQLAFHVAIGNNDAHAKNVALMHLPTGTELAQVYDAVPNLFQDGLIKWDLALAIDGVFDHRKMSVERILAEAASWSVIDPGHAQQIVAETLAELDDAIGNVQPPAGCSPGMVDRLQWNVTRLRAGSEISEPKR